MLSEAVFDFIDLCLLNTFFDFDKDQSEMYLGEIETWDRAEKALADALNDFGELWQVGFLFFIPLRLDIHGSRSCIPVGGIHYNLPSCLSCFLTD